MLNIIGNVIGGKGAGRVAPTFPFGKLSVKYNATDFSYLTTSATWSDTGTLQAGSNVISIRQISPDQTPLPANNANTGLAYNIATDQFFVRDFINVKSYDRAFSGALNFLSAVAANEQGTSIDHVNQHVLLQVSNSGEKIRRYDLSGTLISEKLLNGISFFGGEGVFYDTFTGLLYVVCESSSNDYITAFAEGSTNWEIVDRTSFKTGGGLSIGFVESTRRLLSLGTTGLLEQDLDGFNVDFCRFPLAVHATDARVEGMLLDMRDGTRWVNIPEFYHGGIVNGNRLWHLDSYRKTYRKYLRFPDMVPYDAWLISGAKTLTYNYQIFTGSDWSISPVVDFIANTGQQTAGNWVAEKTCDMEFRGSASAPTTSATAASDYLLTPYYDANQTAQGWGATTPGAWQATPTTDRYMQVRIKPRVTVASTAFKPSDIAASKVWCDMHDTLSQTVQTWDSPMITQRIYNKSQVTHGQAATNDLFNPTPAGMPRFNTNFVEMLESNRNAYLETPSLIASDQAGEWTIVGARNANGVWGLFVTGANTGGGGLVNQLTFEHSSNSGAGGYGPINTLGILFRDAAGNTLKYGVTLNDNQNQSRMLSFGSDGSTYYLYIDGVLQSGTFTQVTGTPSNQGQWYGDATIDRIATGFQYGTGGFGGGSGAGTRMKFAHYCSGRVLTTQERTDMRAYLVAQGII